MPLGEALGRVLAGDVLAGIDVPGFDRSNVDGFAVRAEDTYDAAEESPRRLRLNAEELATGVVPVSAVAPARPRRSPRAGARSAGGGAERRGAVGRARQVVTDAEVGGGAMAFDHGRGGGVCQRPPQAGGTGTTMLRGSASRRGGR